MAHPKRSLDTNPRRTTRIDTTLRMEPFKPRRSEQGGRDAGLLTLVGEELGKHHPLVGDRHTVGRAPECDVCVVDNSISRDHIHLERLGAGGYQIVDQGSTNGTYVNDSLVRIQELRNGDLIKIGRTVLKYLESDNIETSYLEEIYRLTTIDGLTQVYNKRYLVDLLIRELARSLRYNRSLALVMFDVDHFKKLNDNHGHLVGDAVLKQLAETVQATIRRADTLARYGGEEFAVVVPEADLGGVIQVAEKVRRAVELAAFKWRGEEYHCTVSCGIAHIDEYVSAVNGQDPRRQAPDPLMFIEIADRKLYEAKNRGRNQVVATL